MKSIPVSKLQKLLSTLPGETLVSTNAVGNLLLLKPDETPLGYIDLLSQEIDFFD